MGAVKFIEERNRMCKSFGKYCYGCPAWDGSCKLEPGTYRKCEADKVVKIVEAWSAAHPLKTRQSVFLEQYPKALLDKDSVLRVCPFLVGGDKPEKYRCICLTDCNACRREFWMQEVE